MSKKHIKSSGLTHETGANRVIKSAPIKRSRTTICVFCGSMTGSDTRYVVAAKELGSRIVLEQMGLVYGAGNVGLMKALADGAFQHDGAWVEGVIPEALIKKEPPHPKLTQLRKVTTMHDRKRLMYELSDVFVALPGGYGTLDEVFEMITWAQIGLHTKPIYFINIGGFFDSLKLFLEKAAQEKLIRKEHLNLCTFLNSVDEFFENL